MSDRERPRDDAERPRGAEVIRDEHFNSLSYEEYSLRRGGAAGEATAGEAPGVPAAAHRPGVPSVKCYDLHRQGVNAVGAPLLTLLSRAGGLLTVWQKLGMDADRFGAWYNNAPSAKDQHVSVNRPREQSYRMLDDLCHFEDRKGIVGLVENQCDQDLILEDWIQWYGESVVAKMAGIIGVYDTGAFDCAYGDGPFHNTAAVAYRFRVGDSGWYAYYAAYNYQFTTTNYAYVVLSQNGRFPWDSLYNAMKASSSSSRPPGCPYVLVGAISEGESARTYCQIARRAASYVTSMEYMFQPWKTPQDYRE